jgi:hypothetical protein
MENEKKPQFEIKSLLEKIETIHSKIEEKAKEEFGNASEIKSLKEELVNATKSHKDAIEAQKSQLNAIETKLNKPFIATKEASQESKEEVKKSLISIASKLNSKERLNLEETKSIRFTDATTTGGFLDTPMKMGEIDINKQPNTIILNDIDFMGPAGANEGSVAWEGFDESLVDMYEANEMDPAQISEAVKKSLIKLSMKEIKAKMIISSRVIQNALSGGDQTSVLERNLLALESRYRRKLASGVFQDIIADVNAGNIGKVQSTTNEAPANAQAREDLRMFPTNLKVDYIPSSIMYVSRAFLNACYSKEASDGHLATEQFITNANGITSFVTPERAIPVRVFEHNQIGNYKSLADGTTNITSDYVNGSSTNTGKLLAIVADFRSSYKLIPSSIGTIGYDSSISNILDGACPAGKVSFAAQGVVLREGVKVFYAS